jgi:hypothetical protein
MGGTLLGVRTMLGLFKLAWACLMLVTGLEGGKR